MTTSHTPEADCTKVHKTCQKPMVRQAHLMLPRDAVNWHIAHEKSDKPNAFTIELFRTILDQEAKIDSQRGKGYNSFN